MSFLKITDPAKRDFIVEEFLKTKKKIQQNFFSERLGNIGLQHELTKLYKPITDAQKSTQEDLKAIKAATSATSTALQALQQPINLPQYPSIEVYEDAADDVKTLELGAVATQYLKQYTSNKRSVDTTFGIHSKNGIFYIGEKPIEIEGDNVLIDRTYYKGTPGLWELLTMAKPNNTIYDSNDLEAYADILARTNAMSHSSNPNKPKSSRSEKYNDIIKPLWNRMLQSTAAVRASERSGRGLSGAAAIILPQDPNALVEMLTLRMASHKAGNTGVRNEIIAICDELLRQGQITKEEYKKLIV
jgi:hypothetical protein